MKITTISVFIIFLLSSCIPEESPITPIERGDLTTAELDFTMYDYTSYFNLASGSFISQHSQYNWDIAFDCRPDSHYVVINTGKSVKGAAVTGKPFKEVNSQNKPDSLFIDHPNGYGDRTVFGDWWQESGASDVFVLNTGINQRRRPQGDYKVQLKLNQDKSLEVRYQKFGEEEQRVTLIKDPSKNYVYLNFREPESKLENEPNKELYDLIFTSKAEYVAPTAVDEDDLSEAIQYQVRGVYLNPYQVEAALFENLDSLEFIDITYDDVSIVPLKNAANVIGWDWKSINLDANVYSVDNSKTYLIKSVNGLLYKMRFIKFYNDEGSRGYPEFEIKQL